MAWLDATPEGGKRSRRETWKGSALVEAEPSPEATWIVVEAIECGLCQAQGQGITEIPWSEIQAWMQATGYRGAWVAQTVKWLSQEYVREFYAATDPNRQAPIVDTEDEEAERRAKVNAQFHRFIKAKG